MPSLPGSLKNVTTLTEAVESSIRNSAVSGAPTAWATRVLIGVTWLTTITVRPAYRSTRRDSPASTRSWTSRNDSPPPAARSRSPSHRSSSSGCRSRTWPKLSPSHAPNSISANPGSSTRSSPRRSARISAASRVRRTGDATTASTASPSGASQSATSRTWARPSSLRPGLLPPSPPENRLSAVCDVAPCRTSTSVVTGPGLGDQPWSGSSGASDCQTSGSWAASTAESAGSAETGSRAWSVAPERRPSRASLASRSACLFCSRGTQVNVVRPGRVVTSALALSASGLMSACLIFQLPLICSTTSLESIRTSTSASGATCWASVRPAIRPRYSATLLLATPIVVPSSASTRPVSSSLTSAPYAAGPGLPREPPSASMTTRRTSFNLEARLVGADQDPAAVVAPDDVVGRRRADGGDLRVVEVEHAAAAAARAQQGRAHTALALAQAVVEREQVGRDLGGHRSAPDVDVRELVVDLLDLLVPRGGGLGDLGVGLAEPRGQAVQGGLGLLQALHDLDLVVLQRGDASLERHHLLLHPLDVLGVADQTLVDPLLVALAPRLHLLDVGVDLGLLGGQVVDEHPGVHRLALDPRPSRGQLGEPGELGQRAPLVAQLVGA